MNVRTRVGSNVSHVLFLILSVIFRLFRLMQTFISSFPKPKTVIETPSLKVILESYFECRCRCSGKQTFEDVFRHGQKTFPSLCHSKFRQWGERCGENRRKEEIKEERRGVEDQTQVCSCCLATFLSCDLLLYPRTISNFFIDSEVFVCMKGESKSQLTEGEGRE